MAALRFLVVCIVVGLAAGSEARAQIAGVVSEIRAGVTDDDTDLLRGGERVDGIDLNAEVLFASPGILCWILSPRPHLGLDLNTAGEAHQGYLGLTWTAYPLDLALSGGGRDIGLWAAAKGGGAYVFGRSGRTAGGDVATGSRALFRLGAEVGYDVTDALSVSFYYHHESNSGLADRNRGLDTMGVRLGWRL